MTKPALAYQAGDFSSTTYQFVTNTTGAAPTWTPATAADTTVTAQADFVFGQGHEWNDGLEYMSFADIPAELRDLNVVHAAEAIDTLVRDTIVAGTNVAYANAEATRPDYNQRIILICMIFFMQSLHSEIMMHLILMGCIQQCVPPM